MKDNKELPMSEINIIKTASCLSLSEQSTLTYNIGSLGDCQYIRVISNTASGLFCNDWIPLAEIQGLLAGSQKVTSKTLQPLYAGKSTNSPGFLLACILHERGNDGTPSVPETTLPETTPPKKNRKVVNKKSESQEQLP